MGIFKTAAKVVGTVALVATGTTTTILKGAADAAGVELASEILGAAKDASFGGIRAMWDSEGAQNAIDVAEDKLEDAARRNAANTAYRAAQIAKKHGDMEKYEQYMDVYDQNK